MPGKATKLRQRFDCQSARSLPGLSTPPSSRWSGIGRSRSWRNESGVPKSSEKTTRKQSQGLWQVCVLSWHDYEWAHHLPTLAVQDLSLRALTRAAKKAKSFEMQRVIRKLKKNSQTEESTQPCLDDALEEIKVSFRR